MPNYLLRPTDFAPVPPRHDSADDGFLFRQGAAGGLGTIRFHDWHIAYDAHADLPNVARFREQADGLCALLRAHAPDEAQQSDLDFLLALGQLFALVVYGQLILEQAELTGLDRHLLDEVFTILIKDFSAFAIDLHGKAATTEKQAAWALATVRRPVSDANRTARVWDQVVALCGAYEMQQ
jgi:hypothetical protein